MKAKAKKSAARTRTKKKPVNWRTPIFTLHGTEEFARWLAAGSEFARQPKTKLVELAVIAYLKGLGFPREPPRRT